MLRKKNVENAWWRMPKPIRQTLVLMVGSAVIIAGIFMLVFPGPGWAAIFLGFAILATEFAIAEKVRSWLVNFLKQVINFCKQKLKRLKDRHKN